MTRSEIKPDAELDEPLRFERLLAEISTFFINLPADRIDGEIEVAQRRVCEFLDLDRSSLFQVSFGVGVVVGAAWGYAWGGCNWRGGDVDIDINRSTNINNNIDRSKYQNKVTNGQGGRGEWKHDPEHRKGVSYSDPGTDQKFDRGASRDAQSREAFRGRADAGRQDIARGDADQFRDRAGSGNRSSQDRPNAGSMNRAGSGNRGSKDRPEAGLMDHGNAQQRKDSGGIDRAGSTQRTDKSAFGNSAKAAGRNYFND